MAYTYLNPNAIGEKSITADKISDKTITKDKLADNTITKDKLANKTITADKISDKTITKDKLADDVLSSIGTPDLSGYLPLTGGTLTGNLEVGGNVTTTSVIASSAAFKSQITVNDNIIPVIREGGTTNIMLGSPNNKFNQIHANSIGNASSQPSVFPKEVLTFGVIRPYDTSITANLGDSSRKFNTLYANNIGGDKSYVNNAYISNVNAANIKINSVDITPQQGYCVWDGSSDINSNGAWAKVWSVSPDKLDKNSDISIVISYCHATMSATAYFYGFMVIHIRTNNSKYIHSADLFNIMGNMPNDSIRVYCDKTSPTNPVELWYKIPQVWHGMNFKVINSIPGTSQYSSIIGSWGTNKAYTNRENLTLVANGVEPHASETNYTYTTLTQLAQPASISGDLNVTGNIAATGEITAYSSK